MRFLPAYPRPQRAGGGKPTYEDVALSTAVLLTELYLLTPYVLVFFLDAARRIVSRRLKKRSNAYFRVAHAIVSYARCR